MLPQDSKPRDKVLRYVSTFPSFIMACVYLNFGKESLEGAWHAKVHKLISPWRNADAKRSFEKLLCKTH